MPKQTHHGKHKKNCDEHEIDYILGAITKRGVTDRQLAAYFQANYTYQDIANLHDSLGRTALHMAATCGRAELCEWLILVAGANVNAKDWESGYTPLQRAIFYGHISTAVRLMKIGADLMSVDNGGLDAIYGLIKDRPLHVQICSYLPGQVFIWGSNDNYTLGIGTNNTRKTPELMNNFKRRNVDIRLVKINEFHSLFYSRCDRIWACGNPQGGRLGISAKNHCLTPTLLGTNMVCKDIAISLNHTLILLWKTNVLACGQNDYYQLGISPYLKETGKLTPVSININSSMPDEIIGVGAGKYHSVFYSKISVYVCGLNGGQLGLSNTPDNIPYVKVPTMVPINLKSDSTITSFSSSSTCIAFSVSSYAFYILYQFMFKKIALPNQRREKEIEQIATSGGSISNNLVTENCGPLKVAVLTSKGSIFIWQESFPELKRCMFGLSRVIKVTYIFLNERQILFTSHDGEAFSGTIGQIEKQSVNISKETESGFQKFLAKNESYDLQAKRIPNIHRATSITSDPKGKNFAVRQIDPTIAPETCYDNHTYYNATLAARSQYRKLLEEASEEDQLHDITFKVENTLFPAHKFIVSNANSTLLNFPIKDGLIIIDGILPVIFKEILLFIYTGSSDLLKEGPVDSKFSNCPEDPLELFYNASRKYKLESLSKEVLNFEYDVGYYKFNEGSYSFSDGYIKLSGMANPLVDVPRFNRESHPELYDIALKSNDGNIIKAHKCILVARMEYFHLMLMGGWAESSTTEVYMDFPLKYLESLLDHLYKGKASFEKHTESFEYIGRLLIISDQLICETLKKECEYGLVNSITLKNAVSLLQKCKLYNADILKLHVMDFISHNMDALFESRCLEILDDDILLELEECYKKCSSNIFRNRIITPYSEYTISDEKILSSPEIPWPPALTENNGETPGIKNKEPKEREQKPTTVTPKEKATPPKKTTVTEITDTTVSAGSPPDYDTVLNESDFPWLDCSIARPTGSNYKPRIPNSSQIRKVFPPRMSQKKRSRRSMVPWDLFSDSSSPEEEEETPEYKFKGWSQIVEIPPMVSSFAKIIESEQKEKDNFFKMKTKPFALTQLEDKAIEELNKFYNASNVFDERITVQRVLPVNIAKPTWIKSHKKIFH